MKRLIDSGRLHQILLLNIGLGLVVFGVALYFMITGEYADLAARQHAESILNLFAIGGIIYSVVCWYLDLFFNPRFPATH